MAAFYNLFSIASYNLSMVSQPPFLGVGGGICSFIYNVFTYGDKGHPFLEIIQ